MSSYSRRRRLLAALVPTVIALAVSWLTPGDEAALASTSVAADSRVGHSVKRIDVENRPVDVHLWYPADPRAFADAPTTFYTSTLHGRSLAGLGAPLSWEISAEIAREEVAIDPSSKAFPVIVFSHGSTNEPIDYAYTLELIAGEGFVVAAPAHVGNSQDDVRIDFVNAQAGFKLLKCRDEGPSPCATPLIPRSMRDRVKDVSHVLNALPSWFGDHVDVTRAGVMGHSRGSATALTAAGGATVPTGKNNCGSGPWNLAPVPGIQAVMGLAIAARPITFCADLGRVTAPTLLVAGTHDQTSPQVISEDAFEQISSEEKAFVSISNATHRTFDSTFCAQMQASGAEALAKPDAILDRHTFTGIVRDPRGTSGVAMDYCSFDHFVNPVDVRLLVESITGFNVTEKNVPRTGLETEELKHGVKELAVAFFGTVLKRSGNDGPHFTRFLAPKWLEKHEPMVARAEAIAGADAICPPGQEVVCAD